MERKKSSSLFDKWKNSDSMENAEKSETETPQEQGGAMDKGPSIALVKKEPVTFQLSRSENPKDFELMSFVIKVCSKNGVRQFVKVLHVEKTSTGSCLVACDGIRMHVAEISQKIESGDYEPYATKNIIRLGEPIKDISFPNWSKLIPEKIEKRGVINLEKSGLGKDLDETGNLSLAFSFLVEKTGEAVNLRFLEDLTKQEWTVYSQDKEGGAIVLIQKGSKVGETAVEYPLAVIMPLARQKTA